MTRVTNKKQIRMLSWFAEALDKDRTPCSDEIDLWRRRIRQVGTLLNQDLEELRMTVEAKLSEPLTEELLIELANLTSALSHLADSEIEDEYDCYLSDRSWPLDSIEELHSEMEDEA